jgi:thiamine biosynthesis protein ThiI
MLISGGIDSPVAAGMMLERKVKLSAAYFDAWPFADREQLGKVRELVEHLEKKFETEITLYQVPHKKNLTDIGRLTERKMGCVLCRRMMLRVASELAVAKNLGFLVTGESLGQVASQTLRNLRCENPASQLLIVRPLIGLDKIEIEAKAQQFGTYQISIQPGMCCSMAPKFPTTYANCDSIISQEKKLNLAELLNYSLENTKIIK